MYYVFNFTVILYWISKHASRKELVKDVNLEQMEMLQSSVEIAWSQLLAIGIYIVC